MAKSVKTSAPPTNDEIAAVAHKIYEKEGCPEGKAMEHWLKAEAQLLAERNTQNPTKPIAPEAQKNTWSTPPRRQNLNNGLTRK